jgi:hypothetical protein
MESMRKNLPQDVHHFRIIVQSSAIHPSLFKAAFAVGNRIDRADINGGGLRSCKLWLHHWNRRLLMCGANGLCCIVL